MEKQAADRIAELESQNATLRELIGEIVESKTAFQTQWDKDALAALEQMEKSEDNKLTDKLKDLLARCKCGVFLTVNQHRDYYETAKKTLDEAQGHECPPEIEDDVRRVMIETDTIIRIQFYPRTPISSYEIWHHDLDAALDAALACFD
jgi:hypothetical protein